MSTNKYRYAGVTIIELMIALAVGSIILLSVLTAFSTQSSLAIKQTGRTFAVEEGREIFTVTSALLKQAITSSIDIGAGGAGTDSVSFMLTEGKPIWPNDVAPAPYLNNWVKLSWVAQTGEPYKIVTISNAVSEGALAAATPIPLAGDASGKNTKISLMKFSLPATGGLLYQLNVESGSKYGNVLVETVFESLILPRN